jgi:hypothetical protein
MPQPREAPKPGVVEAGLSEAFGVLGRSVTAGLREVTRVDGESGEILGTLSGIAPDPGACVTKELRLCL